VVSYGFLKNIFPKSGRTDVQPRAKKIDPVNKAVLLTFHKKTAEGGILNKSVRLKINGVLSPPSNPWQIDDSVMYIPMEVVDDVIDWTGNPHGEAEAMSVEIVGNDRMNDMMYMDHEMVREFDNINVHVDNVNNIEKVIKELDEQQYAFWSIYQNLKQIKLVFLIIQIVLGCIGAIALVVASIGIANVMIMSIMERTREIGIMKVVGANAPTVRRLFLLESGYIGLLGGALGGIVSIVFSALANLIFGVIFSQALAEMDTFSRISIIPFWLLAFGIVFSFMVGILAGIYPANRAVNLSSIEAIRQD
ncbi:MAG: FtsX-like permease family protein, partial [Firmicutes bacterium]|nr:FtsX-like permease family protein [Bacillota bacterium]